ncbi:hypothetical protein V1280_004433 [Bradyrhizobium sp. AZCC 2230]
MGNKGERRGGKGRVGPEVLPKRGAVWFPDCRPQFLLRIRLASRGSTPGARPPAMRPLKLLGSWPTTSIRWSVGPPLPSRGLSATQTRRKQDHGAVQSDSEFSSSQLAATFGKAEPAISTSGVRRACVQVGPKPRFFRENARGAVACSIPQTPLLSASAGQRPRRQGQLQPCPAFPEWDWRSRLPVR